MCIDEDQTWYEIRVQGHLALHLAIWFDGLSMRATPEGETVLVGPVVDQSALHGYLRRVRDLGLPLLSVRVMESGAQEEEGHLPSDYQSR